MKHIFLIGFMGSGKSYSGRQLAALLERSFIDLDEYIEKKAGKAIRRIFEEEGEAAFREMEGKALREIGRLPEAVVACGGGTPCFDGNMAWMNTHGVTVYLKAPPTLLAQRLQPETGHRPLLRGMNHQDLESFITEKLKEREPFYRKASVIYRQTSDRENVAAELAAHLSDITGH